MTLTMTERPTARAASTVTPPQTHPSHARPSSEPRERDARPVSAPETPVSRVDAPGLEFRFKFLDDWGNEDGFLAARGELNGRTLVLGPDEDDRVPLGDVARVVLRGNRLGLTVMTGGGRAEALELVVKSGPRGGQDEALRLKNGIDRVVSARRAAWRLGALRMEDNARVFRTADCGHCGASVDLTGFAETPTVYCPYCDALSTSASAEGQACCHEADRHYRRCDGCGYFGRPQAFTEAFPVFLSTRGFWRTRRRDLCRDCLASEGWDALCRTLPTVYGAATAAFRLIAGRLRAPGCSHGYEGMDIANTQAHAGRPEAADPGAGAPVAVAAARGGDVADRPGRRRAAGDWSACLDAVNAAWADCSNYTPALTLAVKSLKALARHAEAEALTARWAAAGR
ncbi:MAG: hypothetical protein U0835_16205 [Isosphaeraceae bacterium]